MAIVRRRLFIASGVLAAAVALYALAGFLLVPRLARSMLSDYVGKHYHRTLAIGELHFNPFTLALEARAIALPDADGRRMLAIERLAAQLSPSSLWRLAPDVAEIRIGQPYVRAVIRPDGRLNLADLAHDLSPATRRETPSGHPAKLYIGHFTLEGGALAFEDRSRAEPFHMELQPIGVELRDFSTRSPTPNTFDLRAASPEGGRLHWTGNLRVDPLEAEGRIEVGEVQLPELWAYLKRPLPLQVASGVLAAQLEYGVHAAPAGPRIEIRLPAITVARLGIRPSQAPTDEHGNPEWIALRAAQVQDVRVALATRQVDVGRIRLEEGHIRAWHTAAKPLNLTALWTGNPPAATQPAPAAAPRAGAAWRIRAPAIELARWVVEAEDRSVEPAVRVELDPIDLELKDFDSDPATRVHAHLIAGLRGLDAPGQPTPPEGKAGTARQDPPARIEGEMEFAAASGTFSAQATLAGLPLSLVQPYLARSTSLTLLDGRLEGRVHAARGSDGLVGAGGDLRVLDLHTIDDELRQDFVNWRKLELNGIDWSPRPARLQIASVVATRPYARVIIAPDRTVNVTEILKGPGAQAHAVAVRGAEGAGASDAQSPPAERQERTKKPAICVRSPHDQPATVPLAVSVGSVRILDASANYSDYWIKPNFAVGIESLGGTVTGLSSELSSRARVHLEGKVDRYAPVTIDGAVNPFSAIAYSQVKLAFRGLDLTTLSPYSGHFAGYRIDRGKLSVDLDYTVKDCQLTAAQHFVIDQLQLGDKVDSPAAVSLPLKLAVALLKDRNGVIDLPLPISGSLDDPEFRVGPIVWKVFVNLIEKAVTSPFRLLGSLFGGGEQLSQIDFDPGSVTPRPASQQRIAALAKALEARPALRLDIPGVWSEQVDAAALATAQLESALGARARALPARGVDRRKHAAADEASPTGAAAPADAAAPVTDPAQRFDLLLAELRAQAGGAVPLPDAAIAALAARKAHGTPDYTAANAVLTSTLVARIPVAPDALSALGTQRAQAVQELLVGQGIGADRLFLINAPPAPSQDGEVHMELALK